MVNFRAIEKSNNTDKALKYSKHGNKKVLQRYDKAKQADKRIVLMSSQNGMHKETVFLSY